MGGNVSFFRKQKNSSDDAEEKKVVAQPVVAVSEAKQDAVLLGPNLNASFPGLLSQLCEINKLDKSVVARIKLPDTSNFDNIANLLAIFITLKLPCTVEIIIAIIAERKCAQLLREELLRLNEHIKLTEKLKKESEEESKEEFKRVASFILSIIESGRFVSNISNIFLDFHEHKIEFAPSTLKVISAKAPNPEDVKQVAAALITIADYINSILSIEMEGDVDLKIKNLLRCDPRPGAKPLVLAGGINSSRARKTNLISVDSIELADRIVDEIGMADHPQKLADAIIYIHNNNIPLSPESLELLAYRSYRALFIAQAIGLCFKVMKEQLSEEAMRDIICADKDAQNYADQVKKYFLQKTTPAVKKPPHVIRDENAMDGCDSSESSSEEKVAECQPKKSRFRLGVFGRGVTKQAEKAEVSAAKHRSSQSASSQH